MRSGQQRRRTSETDVTLALNLDGSGESQIFTGVGFFDHMLTLFSKHGGFDLDLKVSGDLVVDPHHTVEDVGIVLGESLREALGDKSGIERYGCAYVPMDEALVRAVVDLSGRSFCHYEVVVRAKKLGGFDTELTEEFLRALTNHGRFSLHIDLIRGRNSHHIIEAVFKSLGRALRQAVAQTSTLGIPSTKGTL